MSLALAAERSDVADQEGIAIEEYELREADRFGAMLECSAQQRDRIGNTQPDKAEIEVGGVAIVLEKAQPERGPAFEDEAGRRLELRQRLHVAGEDVVALDHRRTHPVAVGDARDGAAGDQRLTVSSSSSAGNGQSTPHLSSRQPSA